MMGHDGGPGISFHDFTGTCASSVVFTVALLTAAVLKMDIEPQRTTTNMNSKKVVLFYYKALASELVSKTCVKEISVFPHNSYII